jgi:putative flippase GtrA
MSIDSERAGAIRGLSLWGLSLSDRRVRQLHQFILYGVTSGAALAVDYGLLIFLTDYCGLHYLVSASISFLCGMLLVYVMSITVIFDERRLWSPSLELTSFIAIGIAGLPLNGLLLWGLTTATPLSYRLAKLPTAVLVFLFNFIARRNLLFSSRS